MVLLCSRIKAGILCPGSPWYVRISYHCNVISLANGYAHLVAIGQIENVISYLCIQWPFLGQAGLQQAVCHNNRVN